MSNLHAVSDGLRVLKTLLTERRRASSIRRLERKLRLDKVAQHQQGAATPSAEAASAVEGAKLVA
jgi:hypothetical protein